MQLPSDVPYHTLANIVLTIVRLSDTKSLYTLTQEVFPSDKYSAGPGVVPIHSNVKTSSGTLILIIKCHLADSLNLPFTTAVNLLLQATALTSSPTLKIWSG